MPNGTQLEAFYVLTRLFTFLELEFAATCDNNRRQWSVFVIYWHLSKFLDDIFESSDNPAKHDMFPFKTSVRCKESIRLTYTYH